MQILAGGAGNESAASELKIHSQCPSAGRIPGRRRAAGAQRILLRSGALSGASRSDLDRLCGEYALSTLIDLRTPRETAENPDPILPGVACHALPVMGEDSGNQQAVVEIYRRFPHDPGKAYVEMVRSGAQENLHSMFTTGKAIVFLTFFLLYTPCVSTIAATKRELGGKWAGILVLTQCGKRCGEDKS